ncbi:HNH endonuclease [Streptomyces sp. NPDC101150]|uniref:HNH endonuclease n=1 Tax=Streptomyces sp. NPDC101150 TaxID=3366114 RepID=UPI0038168091
MIACAADEVRFPYLDYVDGPLCQAPPGTYIYECEESCAQFEFVLGTLGHGQVNISFATIPEAVAVLDALVPNGGRRSARRKAQPPSTLPPLAPAAPCGPAAGQDGDLLVVRRPTGPTDAVRDLVYQRDGGRCARCDSVRRPSIHHSINRGMGCAREPWINQADNLLLVCTLCNGWFGDYPKPSYEAGWKVRRPQLPDEVEVRYADGRAYKLTPDDLRTAVGAAR